MNFSAFIFILFSLQVICFFVGSRSSKGLTTQDDYFLAGKGVSFFPLMMTFLATQIGGGLVLGSAEEAYQFGWTVLFYPLGASLGLIVLGMGIGRRLAQFKVSTIAQLFEVIYDSSLLKKIASMLSIITLFMIFVAQIVGSNKFMMSLGIDNKFLFVGFWAIVILYTSLGGLKAVVATDLIQASFFIGVFLACFGYVFYTFDAPVSQIIEIGANSEHFAVDGSKLYGWLLLPLLFMVIEQDMGQRCFAANSPRTVSKATLWAAVGTMTISMIPIFFGVLAKKMDLAIPPGTSVLMMTVMEVTNPLITAFVGCAILAAIISTADSLINAIGSNLSQDFGLAFLEGNNIRASQFLSATIAIAGISASFYFNNIVDLLILSYELSVSCLFVPLFIGIFRKKGSTSSASLAIGFGAISFLFLKIYPIEFPKEALNILFSFGGYCLGEMSSILLHANRSCSGVSKDPC